MPKKELIFHGATGKIFEYARILRKNLTPTEQLLWKHISKRQIFGLKFRRQHPMGNYIADFYCHEIKLVIEIDGKYHNENHQKIKDQFRDMEMERFGITVLRFNNEDVINNCEFIVNKIKIFAGNQTIN